MRMWQTALAGTLALAMTGCVPSLQPLFTDKDTVFEPALNGTWVQNDGDEQWLFNSLPDKSGYNAISMKQGQYPASFEAHLVCLSGYRFLDLYPADPPLANENYAIHFVKAHTFHRVRLEGDVLRIAALDPDWLQTMLQEHSLEIAHSLVDGNIVLTAPTADLQALLVRYAETPGTFQESSEWHRNK